MRNRKKFLAGMLAATMVLNMALSVDVSAEEGSEAQTAENTVAEMNETAVAENNVYYVSSDGNDENSGMSAEEAFKTLDQINKLELQPGDQVLLERGSVFEDQYIHVKGSGTEEKPIIISSYGDESKPLPLINTNGKGVWHQDYNLASLDSSSHVLRGEVSSCILLYDVEYIEISNIAMTNEGNFAEGEEYNSADRMDRTGVAGVTQNIGTADHIVLRNLDIRNIQGNVYNKHMCNGGIYMVCAQPKDSSTGIAKYDDVLIEGCTLDNVNRWGIAVGYTCYWDKFKTAELPDDTVKTYGSTNVVVRNNYLSDLGGDGITMMYCFRPLVERNVVKEFSRDMNNGIYKYPVSDKNGHKNRGGMLAAGIWPWKCKTPLFQYNECYDSYLSQDSQAWDADSGDNCIYQYNYSSNNAGGCVMFCLGQAVNTVFRYNISQNDLGGVLNLSGNPNGEIYNNVFYMKENVPVNRMSGGKSNIYNNIFYYDGKEAAPASVCNWGRIQANWSNNVYYNYSSIPKDENAITEDPQFVNGGKAPAGAQENGSVYDRSVFDGYKLQDSSPAIDAGKPVSDAGGQDFFGNKLDMMPDIGAFETGRYVPNSNSEIVSTPYMITGSGAKQYLNVPSKEKNPTTTTDVLENIEIAPKAQAAILKEDKEVGRVVIEDGMILRVRAESNVTKDYIIKVKNDYDYGEEYSSEQGNVWFYQYKNKDGNYVNMDVQDEWGGWMESYQGGMSNTWATVGFDKNTGDGLVSGPLYNKNGANVESAAMAWRAPKSGSVKLSFGGGSVAGGAKLRGTTSGGPSFLKITKNGEDLITPINMTETNGEFVPLESQNVKVEQGDFIRIECMTAADADNPGFFVTPVIAYNNTGDEEAPSTPADVKASLIQDTKAMISWNASTDNVAVEGYRIYVDGTLKDTTTSTSYQLAGLKKGTTYKVEVEAFDLAQNVSSKKSVEFTAEAKDLIYTLKEAAKFDGSEGGRDLGKEVLDSSKELDEITVTAQFVGPTSLGSLISFSQSSALANHFHLYANNATMGYEFRGEWGNYSAKVNCLNIAEGNAMAFVANPKTHTLKLFVNGELADTKTLDASTWRMLKDITDMDAVTLGWTPRNHISKYPFVGTIMDLSVYSKAMSDEEMIAYTSIDVSVPEPEEPQEDGVFDESGSRYFRIPALITLADGGLMAAADARFGSAADSPNNLDTTVAFRPAGQSEWEDATIPFHFVDISDKPGVVNKNSASFIDPVIVQAKDGTIFLMADAFPYGTGSGQSKEGSGMIETDGNKYLALTEKGKDVTNMNNFTMGIKEDGTVWDFTNNKATEYTVDQEFNLYKNGQALTVQQRDPNLKYNGKYVPMNIFYEDSELQVYRTSYLWMASSKDGGKTWSSPRILNELKDKEEKFLGFGPGRGHVIQKGKFAGRILIPVYSTVAGRGERTSVLYSDDNGITWKKGPVTTLTTSESLNPGKTSEAQFVELPDGSVRMYARGTTGYVGYADSEDGITYGAFKEDPQLAYCGNSMVSVINYSKTIEGKPVLILSSPEHREIRKNGVMRIGLINENTDGSERYTVDWKYRYEINRDEFIYSCLTELPDGNIGLLYETHVDNGAPMNYAEYRLQDVLQEEDSAIEKIVISPKNPKPGDEITATVTLKKPATNAEKLSDATLDILYPGLERGKDILTFQSISEGNKVLTYKGTLAESESSYDFIVRMPEWCSHPTVGKKSPVVETEDGLVNPANKDTVYGNASVDVQQVDKLNLEALIAYAESQKEKAEYADVVDVVKTLFEKTLTEAKAVMADEKAEQAEVDAAYEALLANVHLLGFIGNTDDLALALELAKTTNTEGKTPESVQVLKDAIAKAEEIIADGNVLQEEIDTAREALLAAIDGLEDVVLADKTKLKGLLEDSQKYVEKIDEYTKATADAFMAAREAAQSVYDNQEATQEQVNAAYDTLLQAIFGLRLIPDKSKLEELLKEAEGIDLAKYTEETVVVFCTVLAKAEAVFGNGNASETEVKEAEKMLRAAMDGLEEKKANPEKPNPAQGESGQQGNTKPNGGADKATKTGDEALPIVWMMLMVAGAVVVFKRKKRSI